MFDSKNLYVLNKKDINAIVYEDADGCIIRLTRDMFATQEEFDQWKKWSDEDYHIEEKARHLFTDHTISLEGLSDEAAATATSPEDDFFSSITEEARKALCRALLSEMTNCLSEEQCRRLWQFHVEQLSMRQIAELEGCYFTTVRDSIRRSEKKLKKVLQKTRPNP